MNVELANALDKLKATDKPPYLIIDLREPHEQEIMDLPKYTKNKVLIPRVNIPLQSLLQGFYPDTLPLNRYIILVCDRGLLSGRAADYLKRKGYQVKILLGGIETLDTLLDI